jgi:transcriptional regulator with XRE-family HTH domain
MDWKTLIAQIIAAGWSQEQIAERIGRSQAWVSSVLSEKCSDLKWRDGQKLIELHGSVVRVRPVDAVTPAPSADHQEAA